MERSGKLEKIREDLIRKWVDGNRQRDNLINWMIPVEEFQYREISPDTLLYNQERNINDRKAPKTWRSGIIPVVKIEGEQHWLLSSFWEDFSAGRILTDLGGKCKNQGNNKESPLSCALRETREETKGLLNPVIEKAINSKQKYIIFEGYNKKRNQNIYFYFVFVDYEEVKDIPYQFSQIYELPVKDKNGRFQKGEERLGPLGCKLAPFPALVPEKI